VSAGSVCVVDDHPLIAGALRAGLEAAGCDVRVVLPDEPSSTLDAVLAREDDLVVLDLDLGAFSGAPLAVELAAVDRRVIMLTASDDRITRAELLEAGAEAVLSKVAPLEATIRDLRAALAGLPLTPPGERASLLAELEDHRQGLAAARAPFERLSPREVQVLRALCAGATANEIAEREVVGLATIRTHIRGILTKLDVRHQLAAVALAHRVGWASRADDDRVAAGG
jgi:DNA-binding NarL/FixJ family response regulator